MINFEFNEIKATHAAALFLKLNGGSLNYMKLIKLMYLADRKALQLIERPISTDKYVSMERGPVLSEVYNKIMSKNDNSYWNEYISKREKYNISLIKQPTYDELSEKEEAIISEIDNEYKSYDKWDMVDNICHDPNILPEWEKPIPPLKSKPIKVENILRALDKTEQEIKNISDELESIQYVHSMLS